MVNRQKTEDDESEDDEDDSGDLQGRMFTEAGTEVWLWNPFFFILNVLLLVIRIFNKKKKNTQIERASAGNTKLTAAEKASDPDQPDEFGYTQSKCHVILIFCVKCLWRALWGQSGNWEDKGTNERIIFDAQASFNVSNCLSLR